MNPSHFFFVFGHNANLKQMQGGHETMQRQ